ncbi:MAG: dehydrogenase E1 component subunit alpha/beta [Desulfobacterales bacterium]|jgi:2-oxoisovalerate dehydrogenase E1 component
MTAFRDKQELVRILSALWDEIFSTPEITRKVADEKLIVKFRFTDFETDFFIDITGETPRYYWDPQDRTGFDVEMILTSETNHQFWMQTLRVPMAIATRKIIAKGSVPKALKLIPALKPAFALYPPLLRSMGREDLLQKIPLKKRKRAFRLFGARRPKTYSLGAIPEIPMRFADTQIEIEAQKKSTPAKTVYELDLLKTMYTIRAFEQQLSKAFQQGDIPTEAIHLSIGQEAVAAGVCMNLRDSDYLNTTHRGHGHIIAKGADIKKMMAELYGKAGGLCKGKGGSMHVTDGKIGVLGANGIVGAGYLLALGAGFTIKYYEKGDDISVIIAGDGSVNQGMFHEAMNMISLLELPVLTVIENNRYGEFTAIDRHSAVIDMYKRAKAYAIESHQIDGNDVQTVFSEVGKIIEAMRSDGKPRLVELMTYRWHGHMEGDAESYRSAEEKEKFRKEDPILQLETHLTQQEIAGAEDIQAIKKAVDKEIAQAVAFAEQSEVPQMAELLEDIYRPEDNGLYTGSFDYEGEFVQKSVSEAINEALAQEMQRDQRVFLWGEDISLGGYFNVTSGLIEKFGKKRVIDTPISENGFIGGAVGAAMTGMRPVSEIMFADFLTCCMDPILNQAAKLRYMTGGQVAIPLTIRTPLGSGIGMAAQHSQSMEKFFFGIPGLIVMAPSDAFSAMGLLKSAIRSNNPVLFFEHKLLYAEAGKVPKDEYILPIGKARIVRPGSHATVVTYLLGVGVALEAAKDLSESGIEVEVIDLATLYPMDTKTILDSVAKTGYLMTVEEAPFSGSIGSEVISRTAQAGFNLLKGAPVKIASPECPIPYAKNLENAMLPTAERIIKAIEMLLG